MPVSIPAVVRRALAATILVLAARDAGAQSQREARTAWERLCTIRREKFDRILPEAMRENQIDMWIVAMKEGHYDPLWELLGRGYVGNIGYYIFTDRGGDRIERAAIGEDVVANVPDVAAAEELPE